MTYETYSAGHDERWLNENVCGVTERNCLENIKAARDYHEHMASPLLARIAELESILQQVPDDPYWLDATHIKNDQQYAALVPDPVERTGISWYLMGCGFRNAIKAYEKIRDDVKIQPNTKEGF